MKAIAQLLAGSIPPHEAFWSWLIARGLVVNLACTFAAMAIVATAADGPAWLLRLAVALHLAAVPFNMVCLLGVWRAVERRPPDAREAALLRAASVAVFVVYLVL